MSDETINIGDWLRDHAGTVVSFEVSPMHYSAIECTVSHPKTYLPDRTGRAWSAEGALQNALKENS